MFSLISLSDKFGVGHNSLNRKPSIFCYHSIALKLLAKQIAKGNIDDSTNCSYLSISSGISALAIPLREA